MQKKEVVKNEGEERTLEERFYVQQGDKVRRLTIDDKPEEKVYVILPRKKDSKAAPVEVAGVCPATNVRFIALVPPRLQKDGSWQATLTVHPVVIFRKLLGQQRRDTAIKMVSDKHGKAVAALWGSK